MKNIHCEACDTCESKTKEGYCTHGTKCNKFRKWFSREWERVTSELKPKKCCPHCGRQIGV